MASSPKLLMPKSAMADMMKAEQRVINDGWRKEVTKVKGGKKKGGKKKPW